jgi:hypothetical protein
LSDSKELSARNAILSLSFLNKFFIISAKILLASGFLPSSDRADEQAHFQNEAELAVDLL